MLRYWIDHEEVFAQTDASFEFIRTNSILSQDGDSSYNISFDMREPRNAKAFHHISRLNSLANIDKKHIIITDTSDTVFDGCVSFLGYEGNILNLQALGGDAEVKYLSSDISLRKLNLGTVEDYTHEQMDAINETVWPQSPGCFPPVLKGSYEFANTFAGFQGKYFVNFQNAQGKIDSSMTQLQPYVLEVIKRVLDYYGWTIVENYIATVPQFCCLYVVNGFTQTKEFAKLLPDWTASEFLDEVRKFFNVVFVYDNTKRTVRIVNATAYYQSITSPIVIGNEEVLRGEDAHSVDVEVNENVINYSKFRYDLDNTGWYMYQDIDPTVVSMCSQDSIVNMGNYENDAFVIFSWQNYNKYKLVKTDSTRRCLSLQRFGTWNNRDDDDAMTLRIIPADVQEHLYMLIYSVNGDAQTNIYHFPIPRAYSYSNEENQPPKGLEAAIKEGADYDPYKPAKLYVAYKVLGQQTLKADKNWDDGILSWRMTFSAVSPLWGIDAWSAESKSLSLIYDLSPEYMSEHYYQGSLEVDFEKVYCIRFRSKSMPSPEGLYIVAGRKFLCRELHFFVEKSIRLPYYEGYFYAVK